MRDGYWHPITARSLSRRRALATAGSLSAGAALLAACGSSGSKGSSGGASSTPAGLVTAPIDSSKQAKRGGTLLDSKTADINDWDVNITSSAQLSLLAPFAYSRLLQAKAGYLKSADGEIVGDLASSYEWSPDALQLTLKIRPNVVWHNIAPVNGRMLDIDDVMFSWNRFARIGSRRAELLNSVNANAPVTSVTAPDANTIVFKLKSPFVSLINYLGIQGAGNPHILPKEADSGFDLKQKVIGTGPYVLSQYTPSVGTVWKRNPQYYDKDRPYIDTINEPIISEYAQGLAQLQAGNLHTFAVRGEDIVNVKNQVPDIRIYQSELMALGQQTVFGWKPDPPDKTPFRDVRLRQAYSMALDRDLVIDVVYNVSKFKAQGLPVDTRWSTALAANSYEGWWLDPKGKDFGPNATYFQHDVAAAKKLIAAAGFTDGVSVTSNSFTTTEYGTDFPKQVEVLEGMAAEAGFKWVKNIVNYNTNFIPQFRDSKGNFEGLSYKLLGGGADDAVSNLLATYGAKGGSAGFYGFDVNGKGTFDGDPYVDDTLAKAEQEPDQAKARALVADLQRYLAKQQYAVRWPGGATGFLLAWPALQNFQVFLGDRKPNFYYWLDDSQAPKH